jgi:hypothetical protein
VTDWRLPENKREAFLYFYEFHLTYQSHPGCVYALLPAIADAFDLNLDQRAWLVWLNGNTQNVVTSLLLLEAAPRPQDWKKAVDFWNENFKLLEWDTDRRHQKSKFGEATEKWWEGYGSVGPAYGWMESGLEGWGPTWAYAFNQPYMGRLSSWSMIEYARILFAYIPDAATMMLEDKSGSKSHRNGTAVVAGYDATYWDEDTPDMLGILGELNDYAEGLLAEAAAHVMTNAQDVSRLTLESALCTFKSWHKPNRRYPNVYSDMMYQRIKKAEARFGRTFDLLWDTRKLHLPEYLRLEDNPYDPGLAPVKQNWFLETGEIILMGRDFPELGLSGFDEAVATGAFGERKDPKWN